MFVSVLNVKSISKVANKLKKYEATVYTMFGYILLWLHSIHSMAILTMSKNGI